MLIFLPLSLFGQAHDVVAHEVYGEEAVRVTPPSRSAINPFHLLPNKSLTLIFSAASTWQLVRMMSRDPTGNALLWVFSHLNLVISSWNRLQCAFAICHEEIMISDSYLWLSMSLTPTNHLAHPIPLHRSFCVKIVLGENIKFSTCLRNLFILSTKNCKALHICQI